MSDRLLRSFNYNTIAMLAISRGARVIEKHIALEGQKDGFILIFP